MMLRRRFLLPLGLVALVATTPGLAAAAWNTNGAANGAAATGTLTAPTTINVPGATVTNGTVAVSWSGATAPAGAPVKYLVERKLGAGAYGAAGGTCASTFATPISGTSCSDSGVPDGTYRYRLTTRVGTNWQAVGGDSGPVTVVAALASPAPFVVTAPGSATAGTPISVTIQARTTLGDDTSYTGAHAVTVSGPGTSPSGNAPTLPTTATFNASGFATVSLTLTKGETVAVTVTDGTPARSGSSSSVVVSAAGQALTYGTACSAWDTKKSAGSNGDTATTIKRGTDIYGNAVSDTAALTVTLGGTGGSWSAASVSFAANAQTSASVTWDNATTSGISVSATASAASRVTATCAYTTTP